MIDGWIKLYRRIQMSDIWETGEAFDRRSAWIDLLLMAAYCDKETMDGTLKRGQIMTSMRRLAERWKWSRSKTIDFMNRLKILNMISLEADNKKTIITIVKYDDFQGERATKKTADQTAKRSAKQPHINNNNNKYNKENISYSAEAEGADPSWPQPLDDAVHKWMQYRREIGRPLKNTSFDQLYKQIEKRLPEIGADRISEIIYFSISQGYQGIAWTALDDRKPSKGSRVYRESPATEKKRDAFFEEFQNMIITDRRKP